MVENISSYECDTEQLLGKQLGVASWAVNPRQGDIPPSWKSLPAIAKRLADDARGVLSEATTADVMKSNPTLWSTVSEPGRYLVSVLNAPCLLVDDDFAGTFNKTEVTCDPSAKPLFSRCLRDPSLKCLNIEGSFTRVDTDRPVHDC